jgi:hypothetical protein
MFKLVRRGIKEIDFFGNRAVLTAKGSGKFAIWFIGIWGGITILIGAVMTISLESYSSFLIFIGLGIVVIACVFRLPYYEWMEFNQTEKVFKYFRGTIKTKDDPDRAKVKTFSFDDLTIDWESVRQFGSVVVYIRAKDRSQFFLTIPRAKHASLIEWLSEKDQAAGRPDLHGVASLETPATDSEAPAPGSSLYQQKDAMGHATMLKDISSWGTSSLVLGAVHLFASGTLNPGWGITLLAVGGLSFLVKEASMFVMYAVALVWVGISNILLLNWGLWTIFGGYQIYLGIMLFQKFRNYRAYEKQHLSTIDQPLPGVKVGRAQKLFPWLGAVFSGLGLLVYVGTILVLFLAIAAAYDTGGELSDSFATVIDLVSSSALGIGIIGFGLSLSSVLSKYQPRWLGIAGIIFGSLLVLVEVLLKIWIISGSI